MLTMVALLAASTRRDRWSAFLWAFAVGNAQVEYLAKDTKNKQFVPKRYANEEFVNMLMQHVPHRGRHAILWTALTTCQSSAMGWCLRAAEPAATTAPSPTGLEMASSQNLRYRSSPGQSRPPNALGWPSSTGHSGLIPTSFCLPSGHPRHHAEI